MKARVKATGKIVDVSRLGDKYIMTNHPHTIAFNRDELDFEITNEPDYWEKLKHQYAGMAMQGYIIAAHLSHFSFCENDMKDCVSMATALVNKLKEEENE